MCTSTTAVELTGRFTALCQGIVVAVHPHPITRLDGEGAPLEGLVAQTQQDSDRRL